MRYTFRVSGPLHRRVRYLPMMERLKRSPLLLLNGALLLAAAVIGCVVNPVTGERELGFVSEAQEIALGAQHYLPARQMQGGDYVLEPELIAYVNDIGQRLARASDRPGLPYEFTVLNDSVPNAWALPGGKIAVNRGLLVELENEAELAAVLGHEIVHSAARHGAQTMERALLLQAGLLAVAVGTRDSDYAGVAVGGAMVGAMLLSQRYSREAELEADRYGMRYMAKAGYDPKAAVSLQETFVRLSEEAGREDDWLSGLFASHPPSRERVAANRTTAAELGGGQLGRERYQAMTATIRRNAPAYEAHDKAYQALQKGRLDEALSLARQAVEREPREARFHGLLGAVKLARGNTQDALADLQHALERDPTYYDYYLNRGLARFELDDTNGARADLARSVELLPTATAHEHLGDLALQAGNREDAIAHYRVAAQSDSPAGRRAREKLAKLEPAG